MDPNQAQRHVGGNSPADFLDLFLDSLPAFVWATDAELRITLLEGSALDEMGLDAAQVSDLIGTRGESFLGTDATDIIARFLPLQEEKTVRFELMFHGRWYSVQAAAVKDASGTMIGSIGVGLDITERHALAEELTKERDALSETQQIAEVGSWSRDLSTNAVTVSHELARILDIPFTKSPISYVELEKCVHPDDRHRFLHEMQEAMRLRQPFRLDHRVVRQSGAVRYVRTQGTFEFDAWGTSRRCLGTMIDTTDRIEAQQIAEHLAYHDALTGLPNRLLFADRIAQAIALAQRAQQHFYVLFIDLDHFKNINDSLGHPQGDVLLVEVANRLRRVTRTSDTIARSGGDEFIILLTSIKDVSHLESILLKIRNAFSTPFQLSDGGHIVTASIGYAVYPADGSSADDLLKHADTAMYDAKRAGRNAIRHYAAESTETQIRRMQLEVDLAPALEHPQFRLFYQPIVDARSLNILGLEALIRWQHPTLGLLEPDQFIHLAEHSDYILALGRWAINTACAELKHLSDELRVPLRLSVNVSPRQIVNREDFLKTVQAALHDNGVAASSLELELTENTLLREFEAAINVVARIRDLGVGIAIDDFGTGYNSFAYLKHFPATSLKIDRSFISNGGHAHDTSTFNEAISSAIATLGKSLGLRVIAEGIETREQCELLQALGCDELQGFYFARPMLPHDLLERYAAV